MRSLGAAAAVIALLTATATAADTPPPITVTTDGDVTGEVALVDGSGRILRRLIGLGDPIDLSPSVEGTYLLVDGQRSRILEIDLEGHLLWSWRPDGAPAPFAAVKLLSGNVLYAADRFGAAEVDPDGNVVWRIDDLGVPVNSAIRMPDGSTLLVTRNRDHKLFHVPPGGTEPRPIPFEPRDGSGHWTRGIAARPDGSEFFLWDMDWPTVYRARWTGEGVEVLDEIELHRVQHLTPDGDGGFAFSIELDFQAGHWRPDTGIRRFPVLYETRGIAIGPGPGEHVIAFRREPDASWPESRRPPERSPVSWPAVGVWAAAALLLSIGLNLLAWRRASRSAAVQAAAGPRPAAQVRRVSPPLWLAAVGALTVGLALAARGNHLLRHDQRAGWFAFLLCGAVLAAGVLELWRRTIVRSPDPFWQATLAARPRIETPISLGIGAAVVAVGCGVLFWARSSRVSATHEAGLWLALVILLLGMSALSPTPPWRRLQTVDWRFWGWLGLPVAISGFTELYRLRDLPVHIHFDNVFYSTAVITLFEGRISGIWDFGFIPGPRIGLVPSMIGIGLAGPGELGFRLGSALFGITGVVAVALLGRCYRDRWTGILAAVLLAGSIPFIHFTRTGANGDAAVASLWVITLFALAVRHGKAGLWILAGLASGYSFYLWIGARTGFLACALGGLLIGIRSPKAVARRVSGILLMILAFAVWIVPLIPSWLDDPQAAFPRAEESLDVFKPSTGVDAERFVESFGVPLAKSLGWFFALRDNSTHGTLSPGCNEAVAVVLAVGLVIVLIEGFSLNVIFALQIFVVLLTMGAFAGTPPWYTRMLASLPIAMVLVARTVVAIAELVGRGPRGRAPGVLVAAVTAVVIIASPVVNMRTYTTAEWTGVDVGPLPSMTVLGRRLRDLGPEYHDYLVTTASGEWSCDARKANGTFGVLLPYIWNLHATEVRDLPARLPLPGDEAATIAIQSRRIEQDLAEVKRWYPKARVEELYARKGFLSAGLVIIEKGYAMEVANLARGEQ